MDVPTVGKLTNQTLEGRCHCGSASWTFEGMPESVTACNCTSCRRTGTLWIYDYVDGRIAIAGPLTSYVRRDLASPVLENLFCPTCGNMIAWRGLVLEPDGRRRLAVNVRLTEPGPVAHLPIDHFDGLDTFTDLPRDGRCVSDLWF